jgi:hypothetical protein
MDPHHFDFEEIRPYREEEIPQVLRRISEKTSLYVMTGIFFPELTPEQIRKRFHRITTTEEFQDKYMGEALRRMVAVSVKAQTVSGLQRLDPAESYLFIANHRDIVLDPGIFNEYRFSQGYPTTLNAIGDNLLVSSLVTDLMKLNKSFIVHRSVPRSQLYHYSARLSHFIHQQLFEARNSIWIAQRSGRAKDGNDTTQTALLKMLNIAGKGNLTENFARLKLVPLSISYEYEPCDMFKAEELVHRRMDLPYTKDDKMSIIRGIRDPKGRVHLEIGKVIDEQELLALGGMQARNEWFNQLALLIDQKIQMAYRLWPTNYLAYDLLEGKKEYVSQYRESERVDFERHIEQRLGEISGPREALQQQLLQIYARPVYNRQKWEARAQQITSGSGFFPASSG